MNDAVRLPITRALISVSDKTGLVELARGLTEAGVSLVSTGSTAARIAEAGLPVTPVEEVTGFPECLDGRVKTLHPAVHAGILADRRLSDHQRQLDALGIAPFDLVVVNLYPFRETVAAGAARDEVVEQIDIGGPSMVRAAAKNHANVAIVVDPARYEELVEAVRAGGFTMVERARLAAEAFAHTAAYDCAVANWMATVAAPVDDAAAAGFGDFYGEAFERTLALRYGENPHQKAAVYVQAPGLGVAGAEQLHGKAMSYNNFVDADAAWRAAHDFTQPAVAVIKHANPCGIAVGDDIADAHAKAHACDPLSAYGGVIACNRPVTEAMAAQVRDIFTEVVIAPEFEPAALTILSTKKNLRLLKVADGYVDRREYRRVLGGLLVQDRDLIDAPGDDPAQWQLAAGEPVSAEVLAELEFAWRAVRATKSNAILLAKDGASVGVGMGQVNRVDSCRLAVQRAGAERARGSVAASDAFFPFADGLQVLLDAGVRAVVQPGGSIRDEEAIAAAQAAGVPMYFTGTRHFAH